MESPPGRRPDDGRPGRRRHRLPRLRRGARAGRLRLRRDGHLGGGARARAARLRAGRAGRGGPVRRGRRRRPPWPRWPTSRRWSTSSAATPRARACTRRDPEDFDDLMRLNVRPVLPARARRDAAPDRARRRGVRRRLGARRRCDRSPARPATSPPRPRCSRLIQALDAEYKHDGIRCNAILPSVIDTPANRDAQPNADYSKWVQPEAIAKVDPLPRLGRLGAHLGRRRAGLRARVVRQRAPADLLRRARVLHRADRGADQRDVAGRRSGATMRLARYLSRRRWSRSVVRDASAFSTIAWAISLPMPSSALRASAGEA